MKWLRALAAVAVYELVCYVGAGAMALIGLCADRYLEVGWPTAVSVAGNIFGQRNAVFCIGVAVGTITLTATGVVVVWAIAWKRAGSWRRHLGTAALAGVLSVGAATVIGTGAFLFPQATFTLGIPAVVLVMPLCACLADRLVTRRFSPAP